MNAACFFRATAGYNADDLGNDISSPANDYSIANTNIFAVQLVDVMQGRVADGYTADKNRFQPRNRGQCSGSPYLKLDTLNYGQLLLGRKLMSDSPPGCPRYESQFALLQDVVSRKR